jgi:pyruvate formate lyase activating enzyme
MEDVLACRSHLALACMPIRSDPWKAVLGYEPMSLCDWPGKVCCVLFMGGCDLRCPTCHNWEIAWYPKRFPGVDSASILFRMEDRRQWLDGIVLTGGEPTFSDEFPDLVEELLRFDMPLKVDTNGMRPGCIADLLAEQSRVSVAVDFKGPFHLYPGLTGGMTSEAHARENLSVLFELAREFPGRLSFRCTQVPDLGPEEIALMKSMLPRELELTLQQFIPPRPRRSEHAQADPQT